jgi:hypothetical protein
VQSKENSGLDGAVCENHTYSAILKQDYLPNKRSVFFMFEVQWKNLLAKAI